MNPRERWLAALSGKTVDRVPLHLPGFHYRSVGDAEDPARRPIVERIVDRTHFNVVCPSHINRYLVTPPQRIRNASRREPDGIVITTSEIDTPGGTLSAVTRRDPAVNTAWTVKYPVECLEDVERIRSVPWELPSGLAPPDLSALPAGFGERGVIRTDVSSPFVCVAGMMPYQYFLELCATELGLLRELTAQCLERILSVLDVVLSQGTVECVWMGGCEWLTPPMGSPRLYAELVQPFEKAVIERVHAAGAVCHLHCHGRVRSTLEAVIERGADYFEPVEPPPDGDITMAEAKALAAGRITLGGNVEARILLREGPEAVDRAARAAFEGGRQRMVLQPTEGPLSALTEGIARNYHRLIDVWEELSPLQSL